LAALIAIPYSYHTRPTRMCDTNFKGHATLVQSARDLGGEKGCITSERGVRTQRDLFRSPEDHPLQGHRRIPRASAARIKSPGLSRFFASFVTLSGSPVLRRSTPTVHGSQSRSGHPPTILKSDWIGRRHVKLGALHPTRSDFPSSPTRLGDHIAGDVSEANNGVVVTIGSGFEIFDCGYSKQPSLSSMGQTSKLSMIPNGFGRAQARLSGSSRAMQGAEQLMIGTPRLGGLEGFKRGLGKPSNGFLRPAAQLAR